MARLREIVAMCLALFLIAAPIFGAPTDVLGTIVTASDASVTVGTTVFPGDKLITSDRGSLQVRTAAARLQLSKASIATLNKVDGVPAATLLRGTAIFSTANAKAFALNVASATIRPRSDDATIGEIAVLGEKEFVVRCTKGALTITVGDDSRVIAEGNAYRVVLVAALASEEQSQPPPQGAGTKGPRRFPPVFAGKNYAMYSVAAGVTVVTVLTVLEALESPDRP